MELKDIQNRYRGKGGGPESESILNDSNGDKTTVNVWTDNKDAAKIIERCGSAIISAIPQGGGVSLTIKRTAFRGIPYAFKKLS